jgi:hypothetical protein
MSRPKRTEDVGLEATIRPDALPAPFKVKVRLMAADESLIAEVQSRFGYTREEAIEELWLAGGI